MNLELKELIRSGGSLPFEFDLDLSEMDFYGDHPYEEPIHISGVVRNHAGLLMMTGEAGTTLHVHCSRCGKPIEVAQQVSFEHMLADHLDNEEDADDEIVLLNGTVLDAGDAVTDDMVYAIESSYLCREDCKGRCIRCGKDLNLGPCNCKPEIDPRMSALAKLLEEHE